LRVIAIVLALAAGAQDRVDVRPAVDLTIVGVTFAGTAITEIFRNDIVEKECRWCDTHLNAVDSSIHDAMTGWLMSTSTADKLSTALELGLVAPAAFSAAFLATGPYASEGAGWRASLIIVESAAVSSAIVQTTKFIAVRQRPYARYGTGNIPSDADSRLSFPSGHTAFAASMGFSAAMTAQLQESSAAPWLWAAAGLETFVMGSLRIIAERHYFTDTLAGAASGGACGVIFPLLHKRGGALSSPADVSVGAQGSMLAVSGRF
jgi:membrane-associated phospholipid phosphatase